MLVASENVKSNIISSVRYIKARVELYNGSTLLDTFRSNDKLIDFTIERVGNCSKLFGFGVFQKIVIKLLDRDRVLNLTSGYKLKVVYEIAGEDVTPYPFYFIKDVVRDENTNNLTVTAYDALKEADRIEARVINILSENYLGYMGGCAEALGLSVVINENIDGAFKDIVLLANDVNLEGTETVRDILNALAELSHSIYFINSENLLTFKQLNYVNNSSLTIDKSQYVSLDTGESHKLAVVTHTTELGENLTASTEEDGITQYLRDNPFIELNIDNAVVILNDIVEQLGGLVVTEFNTEWKGNPLLEIADKIVLITKDDKEIESYLVNDTITYNGALKEVTSWDYEDNEEETESSPSNLGDTLKQTFAIVNKVDKEITLVASKSEDNSKAIAQLKIDTDSIGASVSDTKISIDELSEQIDEVQKDVSTKITPEAVEIAINSAIQNGVEKVSTSTGFTFNEEGLTISKADSEISTLIDEDGMDISKDDEKVLTADNTGVNAVNLTARQYLIIGTRSRFEDYGDSRTGCFWIGG